MSRVIDFPEKEPEHIITQKPLRLRWGPWRTSQIIQVHVQSAALWEDYREECEAKGADPSGQMPAHYTLEGGMGHTALGLLRHRDDKNAQVEIIYLSALMESLLTTSCEILRTDLIRRVYQEVNEASARLGVRYHSRSGHIMMPLSEDAQNPNYLFRAIGQVQSLREFFSGLKELAQARHAALAKGYVIYYPRRPAA